MLKDITLGQFFPGNSPIHKLDPRVKILLTIAFVVMLFIATNPIGLSIGILFLIITYIISKIPFSMVLKSLKPIIPIVIFTSILNILFVTDESILFEFWIIKISLKGIFTAITMSIRIICLISGTMLLTYTTSPIPLTDGLERLMKPLKVVHFPVHEISMMMTIALRFIPTLIEETDKIMNAQKARGADLSSGKLINRIKALVPILIPLFVSSFRRADELALAMECRCYRGGEGRTRLKQLSLGIVDLISSIFTSLCIAGVILINVYLPSIL